MSAIVNSNGSIPQTNLPAQLPENNREEVRALSTASKIAAMATLLIAAATITVVSLTLAFPIALPLSLIAGVAAITLVYDLLSDRHSTVIIDGRPSRTYFWDHWWPSYTPSYYTPSYYSSPILPVYRRSTPPIIVDSTPHVRVGGGHTIPSSFRSQPPIRVDRPISSASRVQVGGGHTSSPSHVRVGGGHTTHSSPSRSTAPIQRSSSFGARPHVVVGSRRH